MQFFSVLIFGLSLFSCASLTYNPIKTPEMRAQERKQLVSENFRKDFQSKGLNYKSLAFQKTKISRPPSYFQLDSLYGLKYNLEQAGRSTREIDQEIERFFVLHANDSAQSYFIERHIFHVFDSLNVNQVIDAEIWLDSKNQFQKTTIISMDEVEKSKSQMYACYLWKKSFLLPFEEADEAELAFYDLYNQKLQVLEPELQKDFLQYMLSLMQVCNQNDRLDKAFLIKYLSRRYVQGTSISYNSEQFMKMDEFFDDSNRLLFYTIHYQYTKKDEQGIEKLVKYELTLDPYLQLMSLIQL